MFDRLYETRVTTEAKIAAARTAKCAAELTGVTFQPDVSASKASVSKLKGVAKTPTSKDPADAFNRLYKDAQERLEKASAMCECEL